MKKFRIYSSKTSSMFNEEETLFSANLKESIVPSYPNRYYRNLLVSGEYTDN